MQRKFLKRQKFNLLSWNSNFFTDWASQWSKQNHRPSAVYQARFFSAKINKLQPNPLLSTSPRSQTPAS